MRFHIRWELLLVPGGSPCGCEVWLEEEGRGGVGWGHRADPAGADTGRGKVLAAGRSCLHLCLSPTSCPAG